MKSAIGLRFSIVGRHVLRAAAWVAVTIALGMILATLLGSPLAASGATKPAAPGGREIKEKLGPWVYRNMSVPV
jgi:hypothetical protein